MKQILLSIVIGVSLNSFGQIESLRAAQDTRKQYISPSLQKERTFTKTQYVNPFIGTGGHGHTYPGASVPFGMMQLSPDTRHDGWDGCSGYHYSDSIIYGFSHTHLSGTGVPDYCDLLISPQYGNPKIDPGYSHPGGYGLSFKHEDESAMPGFYSVKMDEGKVSAKVTVTERAGIHEYQFFEKKGKKFLLIDLDHRDKVLDYCINLEDKHTISGKRISQAWANEQHFYFYIELSEDYQKARIFDKDGRHKLLLIFPKQTEKISVRIGISAVDTKGAKLNLLQEIPDWSFPLIHKAATEKWETELSKVYFYSKDNSVMTNFYTALYHSFLNPNIFSDHDGRYRGRDNQVHQLEDMSDRQFTVFSLWDTYRATHPLFTLTQQHRTRAFVNTFLRQYKEGGDLPVWELAGNETECMIGYHSVSVIADAYLKGLLNGNEESLLEAMIATSNFDEFGKKAFANNGFISTGDEPESVSKGLEYAYDDFCIAQMLSNYSDTKNTPLSNRISEYKNRSLHFMNYYDPTTKFMRGRRSGQWHVPFDPAEVNFNYTEANSWQYSLYAPHAVGVLSNLFGGKDSLEAWLDRLFSTESDLAGRHQVDITGLIGQYAHGNEPSHHMAYLYNYTNAPYKTQLYVDSIFNTMYTNLPDGLSGNEDCGQMSSWYVLSALGLYQIAPGNPYYEIGRPLMEQAKFELENGSTFVFKTNNNSASNKYIQKIELNGKVIERLYLHHDEIVNGGQIVFTMGSNPNLELANYEHAPTLSEIPSDFVTAPYFENEERIFEDNMEIKLNVINSENCIIHYTTDGSNPLESQTTLIYRTPFTINKSTTIKAVTTKGKSVSGLISNSFVKKNDNVSIKIDAQYDNQYAANGDFTLIDGIRGNNEFRTGDWQGYWAQPFSATISFQKPVSLSEVGIGALSDMKSWIFLPREITYEISTDGSTFQTIGVVMNKDEFESDMYPHHRDYVQKTNTTEPIKAIRVSVQTVTKCPSWHLGDGNNTWLFIDEIFFK